MHAGVNSNALDSFSAQGKQPFQVLGTDSFHLFQTEKVMGSIRVIHVCHSQSLGIKPFICKGISLALDRTAASGSGWLWEAFPPKGWDQLLCPQFAWDFWWNDLYWPFPLLPGRWRMQQTPGGWAVLLLIWQLTEHIVPVSSANDDSIRIIPLNPQISSWNLHLLSQNDKGVHVTHPPRSWPHNHTHIIQ